MKKMLNLIIILISIITLLQSCGKSVYCNDEKLSWNKINNNNNLLKKNGYYYEKAFDNISGTYYARIYYLYTDGVFLYGGGSQSVDKALSGTINVDTTNSLAKQTQYVWGVYRINNKMIEIDHWAPSLNCIKRIYEKGEIINDTTFNINYRETHFNGKRENAEALNSNFYFKPLIQKPDSVNNFIK